MAALSSHQPDGCGDERANQQQEPEPRERTLPQWLGLVWRPQIHGGSRGRGSGVRCCHCFGFGLRSREGGSLSSLPSRLHRGFRTVTPSGPTSPSSSCPKSSAKRLRARLTRLLIVPIFVPQISAAS